MTHPYHPGCGCFTCGEAELRRESAIEIAAGEVAGEPEGAELVEAAHEAAQELKSHLVAHPAPAYAKSVLDKLLVAVECAAHSVERKVQSMTVAQKVAA